MQIVYPPEGHQTYESSTFFIGNIQPGATLEIQDRPVQVAEATGFFAQQVSLSPGENTIKLIETQPDGTLQTRHHTIIRGTALMLTDLSHPADVLHPYAFPQTDHSVSPGDTLILFCPAPPGAQVSVTIEGVTTRPLWLTPLTATPDNREGVFAQLHQMKAPLPPLMAGSLQIPAQTHAPATCQVQYILHHGAQQQTVIATGRLLVRPQGQTHQGRIAQPEAVVRTHPTNGSRLTPLLKDTPVTLSHRSQDHVRIHLGAQQDGWVSTEAVAVCTSPIIPLPVSLHTIYCRRIDTGIALQLPLPFPAAHQITLNPKHVRIRLSDTVSQCDFIHYHPGVFEAGLQEIQWQQVGTTTVDLLVHLDSPLSGLERYYDPQTQQLGFILKTEKQLRSKPFVVVLDPGHGGDETGALAPDGTPEKDLNLAMALAIAETLKEASPIQVVLTRQEDRFVSLDHRVETAINAQGNLLLSLHHNALPDGRDPWQESGISTYYYQPFALPAARHIQHYLTTNTEFNDYGILYDSLHICRVMAMPSLLLELGFLTHPADAARCLDDKHRQKTARAIAKAVITFYERLTP